MIVDDIGKERENRLVIFEIRIKKRKRLREEIPA